MQHFVFSISTSIFLLIFVTNFAFLQVLEVLIFLFWRKFSENISVIFCLFLLKIKHLNFSFNPKNFTYRLIWRHDLQILGKSYWRNFGQAGNPATWTAGLQKGGPETSSMVSTEVLFYFRRNTEFCEKHTEFRGIFTVKFPGIPRNN
jgi:hypothetical protein